MKFTISIATVNMGCIIPTDYYSLFSETMDSSYNVFYRKYFKNMKENKIARELNQVKVEVGIETIRNERETPSFIPTSGTT